ncbi:hypothetical protein L3V83_13985 [Thiotrichales bacterium 19X7-9]|nr:hypothetical protein [Thiotrichales bacterium 19X7-9]
MPSKQNPLNAKTGSIFLASGTVYGLIAHKYNYSLSSTALIGTVGGLFTSFLYYKKYNQFTTPSVLPISAQFLRLKIPKKGIIENADKTLIPSNFDMVFTGSSKRDELKFAIEAVDKARKTIPYAANRIDDLIAKIVREKPTISPNSKYSTIKKNAITRYQHDIFDQLVKEHRELNKLYNYRKISEMDDSTIKRLLLKSEVSYYGVCADLARLSTYHINNTIKSNYKAFMCSFGSNPDIFPERFLSSPKGLKTSNDHGFVIAFKKDASIQNSVISLTELQKINAIIIDPWFKVAFQASDSSAEKFIEHIARLTYDLGNIYDISPSEELQQALFSTVKELQKSTESYLDLSNLTFQITSPIKHQSTHQSKTKLLFFDKKPDQPILQQSITQ